MSTHHYETFLDKQCREAISLVPVYFTLVSGQVRTQSDASLLTILSQFLHQLANIDERLQMLETPDAQDAVVETLFEQDTLPLVRGDAVCKTPVSSSSSNQRVVALLDPQQKARLLAEGIAGSVAIVERLILLFVPISSALLHRTLERFVASGQPQHIRKTVERSHLFSECLMMSQVLNLIMEASHNKDTSSDVRTQPPSFEDYDVDTFSADFERPPRHMGQPGGFGFLALN